MPERPSMKPSPYAALYDIVISQDHIFRRINELVDFWELLRLLEETMADDIEQGINLQIQRIRKKAICSMLRKITSASFQN